MSTSFLKSSPFSSTQGLPVITSIFKFVHSLRFASYFSPSASILFSVASKCSSSGSSGKASRSFNWFLATSNFFRLPKPLKCVKHVNLFPFRFSSTSLGIAASPEQSVSLLSLIMSVSSVSWPVKSAADLILLLERFNHDSLGWGMGPSSSMQFWPRSRRYKI